MALTLGVPLNVPGVTPTCSQMLASILWQRPYHVEPTSSRLITEVKQRWAWLVLGWVTAWEHQVLLSNFSSFLLPLMQHAM